MKHIPLKKLDTVSGAALSDLIEAGREWPVARLFGLPLVRGEREEIARHIVALSLIHI